MVLAKFQERLVMYGHQVKRGDGEPSRGGEIKIMLREEVFRQNVKKEGFNAAIKKRRIVN